MGKTNRRSIEWAAIAVIAASLLTPSSASARETTTEAPLALRHIYDIYLGGIPIAEGFLTARVSKNSYFIKTELQTVGVLRSIVTAEVISQTQGERPSDDQTDSLAPGVFQVASKVREKNFDMRMAYADDAPSEITAQPTFKKKYYEIDPKAQIGALDPVSGILMAFLPAASGDICKRTFPIFDGRRRYDVRMVEQTKSYEKKGRQYVECRGQFVRVGGFSPKMMKRRRFPFYARFEIREGGRPVATQLWGSTDFGLAMATLRQ